MPADASEHVYACCLDEYSLVHTVHSGLHARNAMQAVQHLRQHCTS